MAWTLEDYARIAERAQNDPTFFDEFLDMQAREQPVKIVGVLALASMLVSATLLLWRV